MMAMSPKPLSTLVTFSTSTLEQELNANPNPMLLPETVMSRNVLMSGPVNPFKSMQERLESNTETLSMVNPVMPGSLWTA